MQHTQYYERAGSDVSSGNIDAGQNLFRHPLMLARDAMSPYYTNKNIDILAQPSGQASLDEKAITFEEGVCGFYSTESRGFINQQKVLHLTGLVSPEPFTADYKVIMNGACVNS